MVPQLTTGLSIVNKAASLVGLNSSDPVRDEARIQRIDDNFHKAMAGDLGAVACLRDMAQGVAKANDPRTCAVGSTLAAAYAKAKWLEYQARVGAGQVGTVLIGQSNIPTMIAGTAQRIGPALLVGGGLLLVLALRRRR